MPIRRARGDRCPDLGALRRVVCLAIEMLPDESSDECALLVTFLGAIGIEPIQLCCAEDDRDLLSVIQKEGSPTAKASVRISAHFSTLVHHCAYIAALWRTQAIKINGNLNGRSSRSFGNPREV